MKSTRLFLLLVCMLLLFLSVTVAIDVSSGENDDMDGGDNIEIHSEDDDDDAADNKDDDDSDQQVAAVDVVAEQDLYESDDFEHEEEVEEEEEEAEDDEEEESSNQQETAGTKAVLQGALSQINSTTVTTKNSNSNNMQQQLTAALVPILQHHHRSIITTSLIVYAFRREIRNGIFYFMSEPYVNNNMQTGGEVLRRLAMPSFSRMLQMLLVVHLAWKLVVAPFIYKRNNNSHLQQQQSDSGNFTTQDAASSSYARGSGGVFEDDDDMMDPEENDAALVSTLISLLLLIFGGGGGGIGGMNPIALTLILSKLFSSKSGGSMRRNPTYIPPIEQHYTFERINERYIKDGMALQKAMAATGTTSTSARGGLTGLWSSSSSQETSSHNDTLKATTSRRRPWQKLNPSMFLKSQQSLSPHHHALQQHQEPYNATVIVMDITSAHVTQTSILRDQVSFLLSEYRKKALLATTCSASKSIYTDTSSGSSANSTSTTPAADEMEVVVLLESPGGSASDYALASQQILRLRREPGITVTIAVDKVAASGGYMIACTSSPGRLLAAPFALLGSIGVVGQTINVHRVLEGWGVQPLVFRGGRDKAPVGLLGEVTPQGLAKVQDMVDDTHRAFKRFVAESRPAVANRIEQVATGDVWLGYDALEQGLIDRIITSDEYIGEKMAQGARVLKLVLFKRGSFPFQRPSSTSEPVSMATATSISRSCSLKNLGGQVVLQLASSIRNVLERFAVSLLDQQPQPGMGGSVDLVQDNQPYMIRPKTTATMTTSSSPL